MSQVDLSTYGGALLEQGYEGQVVDLNTASIISRSNEGATAIEYGAAVARGAGDNLIKKVDNAANKILGIALRHPIQVTVANSPDLEYAQYASVPVLEYGRVFVKAGANVARDDLVYVVIATGALTNTSNTNANPQVPGAVWETTTTSGNIGIVKINK